MAEVPSYLCGEGNSVWQAGVPVVATTTLVSHPSCPISTWTRFNSLNATNKQIVPNAGPCPEATNTPQHPVSNPHFQDKAFPRTRSKCLTHAPPSFRAESQSWSQTSVNPESSPGSPRAKSKMGRAGKTEPCTLPHSHPT